MQQFDIIDNYKIIEKIGEGGMGVVYKAEHQELEQIVALKALPSTLCLNPEIRENFKQEAKIQAKLSHPNVVMLHNFFEHHGDLFLVMEYVDGSTLEALINVEGRLPIQTCLSIMIQSLNGLGYAHTKGIIHRDIKPGNIMVNSEGHVKITDFGLAKIMGDLQRTQLGFKGTLFYMSPEQIKREPLNPTSDLYSLGITLYQMVTGEVPFGGESEYQIMKGIIEQQPLPPKKLCWQIPLGLESIILKAISKSPRDRFTDAAEFAEAINGYIKKDSGSLFEYPAFSIKKSLTDKPESQGALTIPGGVFPKESLYKSITWIWFTVFLLLLTGGIVLLWTSPNYKSNRNALTPPIKTSGVEIPLRPQGSPEEKVYSSLKPEEEKNGALKLNSQDLKTKKIKKDDSEEKLNRKVADIKGGIGDQSIGLKKIREERQGQETINKADSILEVSPGNRGIIKIMSYPKGTVFINNEEVGSTPLVKEDLPPGQYEITVRVNQKEQKKKVTIRRNETSEVNFNFQEGH